jgi:hypothetical protein
MKNVLLRYRRVLLVYTIYCRAHDQAAVLTQVPVHWRSVEGRVDSVISGADAKVS